MPDSEPSSTTSAHSGRDIPAEDGGDHCRRRDKTRSALSHLAAAYRAAFSQAILATSIGQFASGVADGGYFNLKRSGPSAMTAAAFNH
jgi:hypothetical protein